LPFTIDSELEIFHQLTSLSATSVRFEEQEQESEKAISPSTKLSFHHLQSLQSLLLKYCRIPETTLTNLRSLCIYGCDNFEELPQDLPFLRELSISYCPKLVVLELSSGIASSNLFPVYSVETSCFGLRIVNVNRKVSRMIINRCKRLSQLTVNESVGYLKTDLC
jgi:hypothetical protein